MTVYSVICISATVLMLLEKQRAAGGNCKGTLLGAAVLMLLNKRLMTQQLAPFDLTVKTAKRDWL